ncbi:hypothetical protein DPMN_161277 [Dreissena polymorpha]|uniref:Uncharacterized protein n=1 Tax=Dreissena polymorpha TaxID=45954 RepID=A0A9D4ENP4_DREPO|nr:hypothetical protein DPMN_161277 [Dreissena polymorpha]
MKTACLVALLITCVVMVTLPVTEAQRHRDCHCSRGPCRHGTRNTGPCPHNRRQMYCCRN